jgi:hypothetical protein
MDVKTNFDSMKQILHGMFFLAAACALLNGCDQRSVNKAAFASAEPEIKQTWDKALADSKANDYLGANTNLVVLLGRPISADQMVEVQNALAALNDRMYAAAAKGDASAQKAVEALKAMQSQSGRTRAAAPH